LPISLPLPGHHQAVREVPARENTIVAATDLGGVQVLKHDDLYLLSDAFGDIRPDSRGLGLYAGDTRVVSCLALRVNGARPVLLRTGSAGNFRGTIQMTNADTESYHEDRKRDPAAVGLARRSLGISRERVLSGAMYEKVTVSNFTLQPEHTVIELAVDVDDADIFEVRGRRREPRGRQMPILLRDDGRVTFRYRGLDHRTRCTYVAASHPAAMEMVPEPSDGAIVLRWEQDIAPGASFSVDWRIWTALSGVQTSSDGDGDGRRPTTAGAHARRAGRQSGNGQAVDPAEPMAIFPNPPAIDAARRDAEYREWEATSAAVSSDNDLFDLVVSRSLDDLRLLTTTGPTAAERYVAAGIPWYTTLFGRDALITGLETLAFRPGIAIDALEVLAARQATTVDDWREAQPGRILHELRTGEMARTGELPYTPYYGSVDATPLWLILLAEVYDWTGRRDLVDRLWPNALAALSWIDDYGTGPSGFVTYSRLSPQGLVNQGWKDSGDSVQDRDGRLIEAPIALAEVQGYVFEAKLRMARLARMRGELDLANRLEDDATRLQAAFEKAFWLPDRHFYAMALGRDGRLADAIGSNPGHCLWSGIVSRERAADVANRLGQPDMDSGWGIRTFASGQPGYNPIGYHTGTVWPHDNALIIAGLKRYGFHDAANSLIGKIFESAQRFDDYRLPELFCGFSRTPVDPPVPYPVACSPQAWSAGSSLHFLQSMLGLHANAELHELELRQPHLPAWLTRVTISNLRVGDASVDLLFHNWRGMTSAEVLKKRGDLAITIRV
jgi:glycogen debranching enzyme